MRVARFINSWVDIYKFTNLNSEYKVAARFIPVTVLFNIYKLTISILIYCIQKKKKKLFVKNFKRGGVIALYLAGKPQVAIVGAFQHLNVNKSFVYRTIARYRDTCSVASV